MASKTSKRLTTLQSREFDAPVTDARTFDVRLVTSALAFFNEWEASRGKPKVPLREIVDHAYGWLPPVLVERARLAGVDIANVEWEEIGTPNFHRMVTLIDATLAMFTLLCSHLALGRNPTGIFQVNDEKFSSAEWFTRCLAPLQIYSRFVFDGIVVRTVDVPLITNVQRAVAYAIAVILENRWHVRDRIRRCPYDRRGPHFFLDYRMKGGRFLAGEPMKYCRAEHANAHRQQLWREAKGNRT
jgi:hypothetical protein